MTLLISILSVWCVALALLCAAGYGIGRWLTPSALRPYELWLTPLWGYGLLVLIAYYGLNSSVTLRGALLLTLGLALVLGVWRLLKPGSRFPRAPLGETLLIAAIGLVAGGLGVAPLLRAGYLAPVGHGWDIEFYLPLAAYLQDYTYAGLHQAAPAPLLNVILSEPTSVRAIGFSYLHGTVDLLGGWSPTGSFPLLLALMRALAVAPVYLLLRVGLRANAAGAALGALLVAGNELLLWISYNNFAMHVSSMPLVPLATLLTLCALAPGCQTAAHADRRFWQGHTLALAGAIAATTMLTLSYHPALLAYGALAGGLGVWALATQQLKPAIVLRGLTIMVGCLGLGWLAHWRAPVAFFDVYRIQTPSIGGERFARPTELLGVEAFHHLAFAVDGPSWLAALSWLALGALLFGIGVALWRGAVWRGPALGLLGFALLYALGLRYVIAFPYGFYKGVSYLSFVPLGIAGVGLGSLCSPYRPHRSRIVRPLRVAVGSALVLLTLGMTGWSVYRLLETYPAPVLASSELTAFTAALDELQDQGTVLLVDHPELRGTGLGIASLGLYEHPWIGRGQTGFALFNRLMPGHAARYGLMHPSEDPRAWGFAPDAVVLRGPRMVLYRASDKLSAFLSGNPAAYTPASGSLQEGLDSLEVQDLTHGNFQVAQPGQPLRLYAATDPDGHRLSWQPIAAGGAGEAQTLVLEVASAVAQTLTLSANGATQSFELANGVSQVTTQPWNLPLTLDITAAKQPIVVRSAQLFQPDDRQTPGVERLTDTIAVGTVTEANAPTATTTITVTGAARDVVHLGLELYEISDRMPRRYGGGMLAMRANEPATLSLDLHALTATLNGGPVTLQSAAVEDGDYFGALWVYHGNALVRRVPFVRFRRQAGQITAIQPLDANATFAYMAQPEQPLAATIGPAQLTGYTLAPHPVQAGADLQLGVQWHVTQPVTEPLLVFAQILGPDDHKWASWDGAAGGDWWPSPVWQPDDRIWQTIPLKLDPAMPPGRYRLVIGLYKAATGERLPVSGPQAQGTLIVLGEIDVQP